MYKLLYSTFKQLITICLIAFITYRCSDFTVPGHLVEEHVKQVLKEEIGNGFDLNITSLVSGEGDADTIYLYVKFDLAARYHQYPRLLGMPKDIRAR